MEKPPGLEMILNGHRFEKYKDPDGDEAEAAQIAIKRLQRRKQLEAELKQK